MAFDFAKGGRKAERIPGEFAALHAGILQVGPSKSRAERMHKGMTNCSIDLLTIPSTVPKTGLFHDWLKDVQTVARLPSMFAKVESGLVPLSCLNVFTWLKSVLRQTE